MSITNSNNPSTTTSLSRVNNNNASSISATVPRHDSSSIVLHPAGGGGSTACAACKYQRRKCAPNCPLAPYFPPDHQKQFLNAHKLFGVSKITKVLESFADPLEKEIVIKSMIYQANVRAADPVGGCYRIIAELHRQIDRTKTELDLVLHQLAYYRAPNDLQSANPHSNTNNNSTSTLNHPHHHLMVNGYDHSVGFPRPMRAHTIRLCDYHHHQQPYGSSHDSLHALLGFNNNNNNNETEGTSSCSVVSGMIHGKQQSYVDEDIKPLLGFFEDKNMVSFESNKDIIIHNSEKIAAEKDDDDNSFQTEPEKDLKGAASLFTLTNGGHAKGIC